jgi:hypothetical protein
MRRILALLIAFSAIPAVAVAQIGITGGFNRDSFSGFESTTFRLADQANGFNTGIFLDFEIGNVGIRPALIYRQLQDAVMEDPESAPTSLEFVEVPLDIRLKARLPIISPYVLAGPSVLFPSSARPGVDQALAGARLSFGFGIGAEWDIGFRIWPEIRYSTSVGGIVKNDPSDKSRVNTFIARLGITF